MLLTVPLSGGPQSRVVQAAYVVCHDLAASAFNDPGNEVDEIENVLWTFEDGRFCLLAQPSYFHGRGGELVDKSIITSGASGAVSQLMQHHRLFAEALFARQAGEDYIRVTAQVSRACGPDVEHVGRHVTTLNAPDVYLCARIAHDRLHDLLSRAHVRLRQLTRLWRERADQFHSLAELGNKWPDKIPMPEDCVSDLKQRNEGCYDAARLKAADCKSSAALPAIPCSVPLELFSESAKRVRNLQQVEWLFVLDLEDNASIQEDVLRGHVGESTLTAKSGNPASPTIFYSFGTRA